ncbi:hypothetical protein N665_0050s0015 [Sinapis alba]|nr:hypothetical protein N665_0050s0015 [Sinapis alba]
MEGAGDTTTTSSAEGNLISAAAFVEGGIQEACDDACSICLEPFCDSDPSTLTSCKHEYHLQCILEWCQRSSQCPMCWQSISLKDPTGQELLEAVVQERNVRFNPSRNATIFRHPTLGDFELQHLPAGVDNAEIEERIIQHLAAAAAMGRARHGTRREGHRSRSSTQGGHPQFMVFSPHPNAPPPPPSPPPMLSSPSQRDENDTVTNLPHNTLGEGSLQSNMQPPASSHPHQGSPSASDSNSSRSPNQSSPSDQDRAGPSELQSFSESLKSRLNSVSTRYKESISKNTRNWKDRFFSRNTSMAELGSEVKREVSAGIATVSRMMERLETRENSSRPDTASVSSSSNGSENHTRADSNNEHNRAEAGDEHSSNERGGVKGTCATGSSSS